MADIVILGAGVMGTAMSVPLCDNGHNVHLVGTHLDVEFISEIEKNRTHPKLNIKVPDNVQAYNCHRLDSVIKDADLLLLGVNSLGIDWAIAQLGPLISSEIPILAVTKGLNGDGRTLQVIPHWIGSGLSDKYGVNPSVAAIGGPAIAAEVAVRRHTCVVFTGSDQVLLGRLAERLRTPYYHIWTDTDLVGVEVCVALKNVYAMAVGLVNGMLEKSEQAENGAAMHNLAAGIFAQGLWETAYLVEYMGGQPTSVYGMPGAGDLYVTCQGGRNSRMGRLLGSGLKYSDAKAIHMADETVEGAELVQAIAPTIEAMAARGDIDRASLVLLSSIIDIVCRDVPVELLWDQFFNKVEVNDGG